MGKMYISFVGGRMSGSIEVEKNGEYKDYIPVTKIGKPYVFVPKKGETIFQQAEDIGHFEHGSTVVLVFEAPKNFVFEIKEGSEVRYGQAIGRLA